MLSSDLKFRVKNNDRRLVIQMHPDVIEYIQNTRKKLINGFMWDNKMLIEIKNDNTINPEKFKVYSKKRKLDVTEIV